MAGKRAKKILVSLAFIYVIAIVFLTNRAAIYAGVYGFHQSSPSNFMLKFNLRLLNNGDETMLENDNSEIDTKLNVRGVLQRNKKGSLVRSEEIIVIDQKEYRDNTILDETNIKQRMRKYKELSIISHDNTVQTIAENDRKKYLYALRYYEQLTMATKNFLSLASLATATGRSVVEPFVNNSRFSGLRTGASFSRFKEETNKFASLDQYFDRKDLHYQMQSRGYTDITAFDDFKDACSRLDLVIHFMYKESNTNRDLSKWYKIDSEMIKKVHTEMKQNGWTDCNFVKRSRIDQFLGKSVSRYVCVDPELIKSPEQFEELILKDTKCAAVILWKGNGTKRTHFPLAPQITESLQPVDIKHSKHLIEIAYDYIRNTIKRPFISVHVRVERHVKWKGIDAAIECIKKLSDVIRQRKSRLNLKKIFLAHDIGVHGSDTLKRFTDESSLTRLQNKLTTELDQPFRFNPAKYRLYDRGAIAIVEMHIIALGESLFTLGKGNFQEWVTDLFLRQNAEDKSLVHRVCEMEKK